MSIADIAGEKPLVITQGDPAGIGLELALMAWLDRQQLNLPAFALVSAAEYVKGLIKQCGWNIPVREATPETAAEIFPDALPLLAIDASVETTPGRPCAATVPSILESIETSIALATADRVAGIVTNPVAKFVLLEAGYQPRANDEFIGLLTEKHSDLPTWPVMMLWSEQLMVAPVTGHVPVADIPFCLSSDIIVNTGKVIDRDLRLRFGIERPRLAFSGLNPHAGEHGRLGTEERDIITPAITLLRSSGIDARGPYAADSMFHERARAGYDVAIAMYHDQALIPIKTLAIDNAVNVTLGLPLIRTSPNHGTAFDIAGRGQGNPLSLISAIRLAHRLATAAQPANTR